MKKPIEIELLKWGHNRQSIKNGDEEEKVGALLQRIKDGYYKTKNINYNIEVFNLSTDSFECDNLFDFLVHYRLVEKSDLSYPIVINNQGQIIDGRHRVCKAILKGDKTIKAIQILDDKII